MSRGCLKSYRSFFTGRVRGYRAFWKTAVTRRRQKVGRTDGRTDGRVASSAVRRRRLNQRPAIVLLVTDPRRGFTTTSKPTAAATRPVMTGTDDQRRAATGPSRRTPPVHRLGTSRDYGLQMPANARCLHRDTSHRSTMNTTMMISTSWERRDNCCTDDFWSSFRTRWWCVCGNGTLQFSHPKPLLYKYSRDFDSSVGWAWPLLEKIKNILVIKTVGLHYNVIFCCISSWSCTPVLWPVAF